MSDLTDILNTVGSSVKNVADTYVGYLNNKANQGLASSQSTIDELKATTNLLAQQNEAQRLASVQAHTSANGFDFSLNGWAKWVAFGALGFVAYKFLK